MRYKAPRRFKPRKERENDPFIETRVHIPRAAYERLEVFAAEMGVPIGRVINYAIYNELDTEVPFNFDLTLPVEDFKPGLFTHEADVVHSLLSKLPSGCGLDMLVLMRMDFGLTRHQVLLGYMELKESGRIEEYYPAEARFKYPEDYRYIRVKDVHHRTVLKNRVRSLEGQPVRKKLV